MTLSEDYASRLLDVANRIARLGPDRLDPHLFLERKDGLEQDVRAMARQVEFDQVLGSREAPERLAQVLDMKPRLVADRKGRPVLVECRGARRSRS